MTQIRLGSLHGFAVAVAPTTRQRRAGEGSAIGAEAEVRGDDDVVRGEVEGRDDHRRRVGPVAGVVAADAQDRLHLPPRRREWDGFAAAAKTAARERKGEEHKQITLHPRAKADDRLSVADR